MPGKKKKFIDKNASVTFHLVHRSQKDPKLADDEAPKHVLLKGESVKNTEEEQKYGVYFDDDYDYMQHLKDVDELNEVGAGADVVRIPVKQTAKAKEPTVQLPSSVFASNFETDVGLLNKAAPLRGPQLDWDPDIVAGLDEDFDFDNPENLLEDDFICQANTETDNIPQKGVDKPGNDNGGDVDYPSDEADEWTDDDDDASDVASLGEMSFTSEETKTKFTNYSMTSSVIRRNEGLTLLDDRFEKIYEQYDETEIGALDHEDIGGCLPDNSTLLNSVLDEFEQSQQQVKMKDVIQKAENVNLQSESESSEDELLTVTEKVPGEKWDCESILSTYSNIYNHPTKITEPKKARPIKLTKRAGIPAGVLPEKKLTEKQLEEEHMPQTGDRVPTYRPVDETPEERRHRKQAVKSERKARREEKKTNKKAFKSEEIRQKQEILNVKNNLKGVKIV